jgi:sugar phosphate isomerase/epimerase
MQLGLVTYQWGAEWDLPTVIKNCEAAGFKGVELRTQHKHGVEPKLTKNERQEVAKRFADSSVQFIGSGTICEFQSPDPKVLQKNIDEAKAFVELVHDIGGSGVKVRPNGFPKGVDEAKTLEQIGKSLHDLAEFANGYGMLIRLEVHGQGTQEVPNAKKIMEIANHDYARLCWNCNPTDTNGAGLEANFNSVRKYFGDTIHVHDFSTEYPWDEFYALLRKTNYEGWTLVEESKVPKDIVGAMKGFREKWEKVAG